LISVFFLSARRIAFNEMMLV